MCNLHSGDTSAIVWTPFVGDFSNVQVSYFVIIMLIAIATSSHVQRRLVILLDFSTRRCQPSKSSSINLFIFVLLKIDRNLPKLSLPPSTPKRKTPFRVPDADRHTVIAALDRCGRYLPPSKNIPSLLHPPYIDNHVWNLLSIERMVEVGHYASLWYNGSGFLGLKAYRSFGTKNILILKNGM